MSIEVKLFPPLNEIMSDHPIERPTDRPVGETSLRKRSFRFQDPTCYISRTDFCGRKDAHVGTQTHTDGHVRNWTYRRKKKVK